MVCDVLQTNIEDLQLTTVAPTLNIFKEKKEKKQEIQIYLKQKKSCVKIRVAVMYAALIKMFPSNAKHRRNF